MFQLSQMGPSHYLFTILRPREKRTYELNMNVHLDEPPHSNKEDLCR